MGFIFLLQLVILHFIWAFNFLPLLLRLTGFSLLKLLERFIRKIQSAILPFSGRLLIFHLTATREFIGILL